MKIIPPEVSQVALILWGAFLSSHLIIMGISIALATGTAPNTESQIPMVLLIAGAGSCMAACGVFYRLFKPKWTSALEEAKRLGDQDKALRKIKETWGTLVVFLLISLALAEAASIFGLVLALQSSVSDAIPLFVLGIATHTTLFPKGLLQNH